MGRRKFNKQPEQKMSNDTRAPATKIFVAIHAQAKGVFYSALAEGVNLTAKDVEKGAVVGLVEGNAYVCEGELKPKDVYGSPHSETIVVTTEEKKFSFAYESEARMWLADRKKLVSINGLSTVAAGISQMGEDQVEETVSHTQQGIAAVVAKIVREVADHYIEVYGYDEEEGGREWLIDLSFVLNTYAEYRELLRLERVISENLKEVFQGYSFQINGRLPVKLERISLRIAGECLERYLEEEEGEVKSEKYWGIVIFDTENTVAYTASKNGERRTIVEEEVTDDCSGMYHCNNTEVSYNRLLDMVNGSIFRRFGVIFDHDILNRAAEAEEKLVIKNKVYSVKSDLAYSSAMMMRGMMERMLPEFWGVSKDIEKLFIYTCMMGSLNLDAALKKEYKISKSIQDGHATVKGAVMLMLDGGSVLRSYEQYIDIEEVTGALHEDIDEYENYDEELSLDAFTREQNNTTDQSNVNLEDDGVDPELEAYLNNDKTGTGDED